MFVRLEGEGPKGYHYTVRDRLGRQVLRVLQAHITIDCFGNVNGHLVVYNPEDCDPEGGPPRIWRTVPVDAVAFGPPPADEGLQEKPQ